MNDTLRVLIVDDERLARHHLRQLLEEIPAVECIGESASGEAALATLRVARADVVLLDVQMPGYDGFDVVRLLPPETLPAVIFVTAHDHYAVKAFEVHAADYLLKPPDPVRLRCALESARARLQSRAFAEEQKRLRALVEKLRGSTKGVSELMIRDRGNTLRLNVAEIDWLSAEDNYVRIHCSGRSHLMRGTIAAMERDLDPERFIRIHRSAIVNIDHAQELRHSIRGGYAIVLGSGERLRVSRAHRQEVNRVFSNRRRPANAVSPPIAPD